MSKIMSLGCVVFLMSGCAHVLLSTNKEPVVREAGIGNVTCAMVNEWKEGSEQKVGCWCMLPAMMTEDGPLVMFAAVADQFCDENVTQQQLYKLIQ